MYTIWNNDWGKFVSHKGLIKESLETIYFHNIPPTSVMNKTINVLTITTNHCRYGFQQGDRLPWLLLFYLELYTVSKNISHLPLQKGYSG